MTLLATLLAKLMLAAGMMSAIIVLASACISMPGRLQERRRNPDLGRARVRIAPFLSRR